MTVGTGDQGFTGLGIWEGDQNQANPEIFVAGLPAPPRGAPPPPPPPPSPPPSGGGPRPTGAGLPSPVGGGPLSPCRVLQYGPLDVVADACLRKAGDVYTATGGVAINGLRARLGPGGELRFDTRARTVRSTGAVELVLGRTVLVRDRIDWRLPAGNTIDLPSLKVGSLGNKLLGFPLTGDAKFRLRRGGAELAVNLGLPKIFGGVTGAITVRADNATGVYIRDLKVAVANALIGPLQVKDLKFAYDADADTWQGSANLILPPQPPGPSLASQIGFREGSLDYLRAELTLPGAGIPLEPFQVVYLKRIRFAMSTNPTKLGGGLTVNAGPTIAGRAALAINGDFSYTFPDPPQPAILRVDGTASVVNIQLARAYFEFRTNGYVGFGGALEVGDPAIFFVRAGLDGWLYRSAFNVEADARACIGSLGCAGARAVVSSVGFGACTTGALKFGGGYRWGESLDVMISGCDVGAYRAVLPNGRAAMRQGVNSAQAGGTRVVRFGSGLPSGFVAVRGRDAPPHVTLVGPGGQRIEAPVTGALRTERAVAFHVAAKDTTYFGIVRPQAGEWRVEARPGSPEVVFVAAADGVKDPVIRTRVRVAARAGSSSTTSRRGPDSGSASPSRAARRPRRSARRAGAAGRSRSGPPTARADVAGSSPRSSPSASRAKRWRSEATWRHGSAGRGRRGGWRCGVAARGSRSRGGRVAAGRASRPASSSPTGAGSCSG